MDKLFREFLMEKEYVCGLAQTTLKTYRATWQAFETRLGEKEPSLSKTHTSDLFFPSRRGHLLTYDNMLESMRVLCWKIRMP